MSLGIFDSGAGGLTIFKALSEGFPSADLIYLGDNARVPYGNKTSETIVRYSEECANFLIDEYGVDILVIACNTISCYALEHLRDKTGLPVFGVIDAGAQRAVELTANKHLGLIGTNATIRSGAYISVLKKLDPNLKIEEKACPLFVPLVEEGLTSGIITEKVIKYYLDEVVDSGIDTIILGCTHYPFLVDAINAQYPTIKLAESSSVLVDSLSHSCYSLKGDGDRKIFVTENSVFFDELNKKLLNNIPIKKVSI